MLSRTTPSVNHTHSRTESVARVALRFTGHSVTAHNGFTSHSLVVNAELRIGLVDNGLVLIQPILRHAVKVLRLVGRKHHAAVSYENFQRVTLFNVLRTPNLLRDNHSAEVINTTNDTSCLYNFYFLSSFVL